MPRALKSQGKSRHDPLHVQLGEDEVQAKYGNISQPGKRMKSRRSSEYEDEDGEVLEYLMLHLY
jgi:essential nuclear protein 1